jgi:hypothetical protein
MISMNFNNTGKRIVIIIISALLILTSLWVSFSAASFQYTTVKNNGRLQEQLTRKLTQTAGIWAKVKIVSGVISVLKTVQVTGSIPIIGGLAISAEPLGWTDVVDNTLDQISNICLWAIGALAIEKMLLAVSIWFSQRIAVPVCAVLIVIVLWNKKYTGQLKRTIAGIIIISAGICAAVPLSLELSYIIETSILSSQIQETINEIDGKSKEAESAGDDINNSSFVDTLNRIGRGAANFFDNTKQTFETFIDHMIDYIMVFILTNLIIPIGTILGLKYLISAILKSKGTPKNFSF